ncbi:MAG: asparagine synthase (glutamine-hydrolyzing) [Alphaproteobacteria bacterium]
MAECVRTLAMCGIAGFLGPWSETLLDAMGTELAHRGPDGDGIFFDAPAGVGLAHRRLSIIDLTDAAAQPMASPEGRYAITFNGEIYNYRELRRTLEAAGVAFRSASDTEILLQLYMREGAACVDRLSGIFAFAIWDAIERRLFLARDHLGVKPLYYAAPAKGFLFASELKALTLCADVGRDIDEMAVADHLGFLWSAGEATMLKSVNKLRPGCTLTVDSNGIRHGRFYRTPVAGSGDSAEHCDPDALTRLIDEVVQAQMVADVEVGALLSGGVDSSAIVAAMCRAAEPSRITTFCATVERPDSGTDNFGDDQAHAREVADHLGVKLVEVATDSDLIEELPAMMWALDEPTADFAALQTKLLARAARAGGIKVLLSGVGGDDLFTGYGRHRAALVYSALDRVPGARRFAGALLGLVPPTTIAGRRMQRMGALLAMDEERMLTEAMSFSAVAGARRRGLLAPAIRKVVPVDGLPSGFAQSFAATRGRHPVERFLDLELNGFLPDHNLNYTDRMAMIAGVEVRVPLADPRMVSFAMNLTLDQRIDFRRTKKILRDSQISRLPQSILTRPKQGFGVPVRAWLQGAARPLLEELTSAAVIDQRGLFDGQAASLLKRDFFAGRVDAAFTLFPMMAMELWCRALDAQNTVAA